MEFEQTKYMKPLLVILLLILTTLPALAQEDSEDVDPAQPIIDSLLSATKPDSPDSVKAINYSEIARICLSNDTCMKYARLSLKYCKESDKLRIIFNYQYIGYTYYITGQFDSSLVWTAKSAKLCDDDALVQRLIRAYRIMAEDFEYLNMQDSAYAYLNKALDVSHRAKDTAYMADCYYSLAVFDYNRQLNKNAAEYALQAITLDSLINDMDRSADHSSFLGAAYKEMGNRNNDSSKIHLSIDCLTKVVDYYNKKNSNEYTYVLRKNIAYDNLSNAYILLAKMTGNKAYADSCVKYNKVALDFFNQINMTSSILTCSETYIMYLLFMKKNKEAERYALSIGKYYDDNVSNAYKCQYNKYLEDIYQALGDWEKAYKYQKIVTMYTLQSLNDSTLNMIADTKAQMAVMQEKYEREKQEEVHAADQRRMRTLIISLAIGLVLVSLVIIYILKAYNIKQKANSLLSEKNEILNSQKSEIISQRDEIATQKDIITEQWHEVETVNNKLFQSINYARRIQRAAVSSEEDVHRVFPDSFVFYHPRDIVSGDYYRCTRCGKYSVMITADCTGHGIPGAFLSMLGLSALKEYMVTEHDAENPGTVLDRMRDFIKSTLISKENGADVNDGMDITICCYDLDQMLMHYAIANQTAYIIRPNEAIKLKGDSMPVGRYIVEKDHFKTQTIPIQKGDMIYTFSDGIQDQIGGKEKRKFLLKNLLALLQSFADKPTETQAQILEQKIIDWRGDIPQVDDMTLIGIRI